MYLLDPRPDSPRFGPMHEYTPWLVVVGLSLGGILTLNHLGFDASTMISGSLHGLAQFLNTPI
jgi:hypothetical protein